MKNRGLLYSIALILAIGTTQCQLYLTIPDGVLEKIAEDIIKVAHPLSEFTDAHIVGASPGCSGKRYIDAELGYKGLLGKEHDIVVRFNIHSIDPCEVHTEVVSDSGPIPPILLDNEIAAPRVGQHICESLK